MKPCESRDATMEVRCFGRAGHDGAHFARMGSGEDVELHRWYS